MIYLDGFSGIGGFHLGLVKAGFKFSKTYYSEIDKYAIGCYKRNLPESEYAGAIDNLKRIRKIDVFTFGFPCQDLSISGNREGLKGKRSGLFFEAVEIIKKYKPSLFIFENVKGLLSSNDGKDFEIVLRTIADIGLYECEWQLVNTRWVLPQNRERVFFIGHLRGNGFSKVFPIAGSDNEGCNNKKRDYTGSIKPGVDMIKNDATYIKETNLKQIGILNKGSQGNRVYSEDGISVTLSAHGGGQGAKTGLYEITTNTKKGSEKVDYGDSINYAFPNSKTRRGRVGKQVSQTLDTNCNIGTISENNIRRLTEIECERLQGFPDNWTKYGIFNEVVKEISAAQRYKMLGNAVTVDIVEMIGKRLLGVNL